MILVGDTSGLVAAFNVDDPEHTAARQVLIEAPMTVISPLVLLEIERIATRNVSRKAALAINDWLLAQDRTGRVTIAAVTASTLRTARTVQNRYAALRLDLTDAVSVVLAEQYETYAVLTLDRRDFRAVVPLNGAPAFRLLPDDS
ncbi:type II toxin-antitoxin system VapC family toxin [Mycolicibacter longobardus]|uniref:Ribonuclease VapC n=1 Tax=Mycolicibacter longobardus TaxID=1108812 RepID=A0A1X1YH31_9MYCO|nr:PIN domain-containing protein [Mycolicibacter longobardus]MCV7385063.1 PIN domain-containing protein [Mycolicibacter longobardus]ORW10344.1 twitching motility protein PilT [Mycolicibacter longobardus]